MGDKVKVERVEGRSYEQAKAEAVLEMEPIVDKDFPDVVVKPVTITRVHTTKRWWIFTFGE